MITGAIALTIEQMTNQFSGNSGVAFCELLKKACPEAHDVSGGESGGRGYIWYAAHPDIFDAVTEKVKAAVNEWIAQKR